MTLWNLMLKLLSKWACPHKWELVIKTPVEKAEEGIVYARFTKYTFCCKNCGKFKGVIP